MCERNIDQLPVRCSQLGPRPATQACALTWIKPANFRFPGQGRCFNFKKMRCVKSEPFFTPDLGKCHSPLRVSLFLLKCQYLPKVAQQIVIKVIEIWISHLVFSSFILKVLCEQSRFSLRREKKPQWGFKNPHLIDTE